MHDSSKVLKCDAFRWESVEVREYKADSTLYKDVTRQTLLGDGEGEGRLSFITRYFEVQPGGYSTLERHEHPHAVIVLRGRGRVVLGERAHDIGPFDCGGLVQIHSVTKEITQAGLYWALVQYARAIRRGAVIVASHDAKGDAPAVNGALVVQPGSLATGTGTPYSAATSRVFHTAAKNPDGSMALVLTNPGDAREMTVACGGQSAKVALTADSITTLRWS